MSITSLLELQIQPNSLDEALAMRKRILPTRASSWAASSSTLARGHDDPTHLIAVETWQSLEHDAGYPEWRAGDDAIDPLRRDERAGELHDPRIGEPVTGRSASAPPAGVRRPRTTFTRGLPLRLAVGSLMTSMERHPA
jgi:hypothetical protein